MVYKFIKLVINIFYYYYRLLLSSFLMACVEFPITPCPTFHILVQLQLYITITVPRRSARTCLLSQDHRGVINTGTVISTAAH